jgi:hypothetical protein
MTPRILALLLMTAIACSTPSASAQTMYRCGSSFQDHPCSGGQAGTVIGSTPTHASAQPSAAAATSGSSAQCSQRGLASQKISWNREAGKTQQDQSAGATGGFQRDLIAEVYSHRGTSVEVRSAIEADCKAAEDRAAQAAALIDAAARLQAGTNPAGLHADTTNGATSTTVAMSPPSQQQANPVSNDASAKLANCQRLNQSLANVQARERAGTSANQVEQMRQQERDARTQLRDAGC